MKRAVLNIADTGALESTTLMLRAAGYYCTRPNQELLQQIRKVSVTPVHSVDELVNTWGYARPMLNDLSGPEEMILCDLFVDVKAHINYPHLIKQWPRLENRILWCCLNGGDPFKRTDGQPWANPPCPVLTNNQWYADTMCFRVNNNWQGEGHAVDATIVDTPWHGRAYVFYPPYARLEDRRREGITGPPLCLVHNVARWGYGHLIETFNRLGGVCYGGGEGNSVLLKHDAAMKELHQSLCMVHLKIGDTVGYAMVEAMTAGVPFICTKFYIEECKLQAMLEPGVTCLIFDPDDVEKTKIDLSCIFKHLADPEENRIRGQAGRERYLDLMWKPERNLEEFNAWLGRNFS